MPNEIDGPVMKNLVVVLGPTASGKTRLGVELARELATRGAVAQTEVTGRSLKASLKWSSKIGARFVVILGEEELAGGEGVVRDLDRGEQERLPLAEIPDNLVKRLKEASS